MIDCPGRPIGHDVSISANSFPPDEFWKRFVPASPHTRPERRRTLDRPAVRAYFFGKGPLDATAQSDRDLELPRRRGFLGKPVKGLQPPPLSALPQRDKLVVADDIRYLPILRDHGEFSGTYYPRRMGDWIIDAFGPAYLLTGTTATCGDPDCADYLLYSQYQEDGSNQFVREFYPKRTGLMANGTGRAWRGGYDYVRLGMADAYGYRWAHSRTTMSARFMWGRDPGLAFTGETALRSPRVLL